MSSRSPRGSLSGASTSAKEVADDFRESLKDLQNNNRYEISNLTVIAQENTEHAQAISKVLEDHINDRKTAPSRKLPALFVLDSIVKNVGTPYTVYLGKNLFGTFMDAYTLVDSTTRRNMEAMLKTWKEPVPGSMDPRPVFPPETVRPIENALNKAKTAAMQHQRQPQVPFRGTATPPQHNGHFMPPQQETPQPYAGFGGQQPTPQQPPYGFPPPLPAQPPTQDVEGLRRDIALLIPRFHQKIASNPNDGGLRNQLAALETLHQMLGTKTFSPHELHEIRNQVTRLSAALPPQPTPQYQPRPTPQPAVSTPQWQPPLPYSQPLQQPPMPPFPPPHMLPPKPAPAPAPGPSSMTPDALNGLQALLANVPKPSTPQMRAAMPGFRDASHSQLNTIQNHAAAAPPAANGALDLISSLTKAGLINAAGASTPMSNAAVPAAAQPPLDPTSSLLRSLQSVLPPSQGGTPTQFPPPMPAATTQVLISATSLKVFRPELVRSLYDAQANQCNTCGRRFLPTEEGREKKSRHLDWHFRTNQRIADPNTNRGHHRNWFVDEMEWIRHTEFDPSTTTASAVAEAEAAAKPKKGPQDQYLRAPAGMTRNTCNICFEEMKSSYSEDLQDWIFANAAVHNGKIVHATCLAEMTKPQLGAGASALAAALANVPGGQRDRSATPDSLLGKRKAETAMSGGGARLRME